MVNTPAIVVLHTRTLELAKQLAAATDGKVHAPTAVGAAVAYDKLETHLQRLYQDGTPIIGICATGILARLLAPVMADKTTEPPVIAVSEDGASIVPVLGGHNGANDLARQLAAATSGHAAITTASDIAFGIAFDTPPLGYVLANRDHIKPFVSSLLNGAELTVNGTAPWLADAFPLSPTLSPEGRESTPVDSPLPSQGRGSGRGVKNLTATARSLRKHSTEPERRLWAKLRAKRFLDLHFRHQMPIGGYIADFACPTKKLIIEVDGGTHSTEAEVAYDAKRDQRLSDLGYTTLRFNNQDVMRNIDGVLETIGRTFGSLRPPLSNSLPQGEREHQRGIPSPLPRGEGQGEGSVSPLQ